MESPNFQGSILLGCPVESDLNDSLVGWLIAPVFIPSMKSPSFGCPDVFFFFENFLYEKPPVEGPGRM